MVELDYDNGFADTVASDIALAYVSYFAEMSALMIKLDCFNDCADTIESVNAVDYDNYCAQKEKKTLP